MAYSVIVSVTKQIQSLLNKNHIDSRRDAGPGVWVTFLLPVALIIGQIKYSTSYKYKAAACISCGLLIQSILFIIRTNYHQSLKSCDIIASCLATIMLLYYFTLEGIIISAIYASVCMYAYYKMVLPLMQLCPFNFTYGEATLVCQSFMLFLVTFLVRENKFSHTCTSIGTILIQFGILCLLVIVTFSYYFNLKNKPLEFYCLVSFIVTCVMLPTLYFLIGENALVWIFHLITEDTLTVKVMAFWIVCCVLAAVAVLIQIENDEKASTVLRKVFHLLALLVFVPGIIFKPCLLYVASGVAFAIFIFLETLRILDIPPLNRYLQEGYLKYADEKDEGPIALTPIYLLAGCSLPIWLYPDGSSLPSDLLPLVAGLLSVGVGDSAASICGTLVGRNKWPGSKRTKEGTAGCFLSQLFIVIALIHFGYVPRTNLIKPTFAIALCSLVEAKTDQMDNIVLPLLMYIMLL